MHHFFLHLNMNSNFSRLEFFRTEHHEFKRTEGNLQPPAPGHLQKLSQATDAQFHKSVSHFDKPAISTMWWYVN